MTTPVPDPTPRFHLLDQWRGVAALWVTVFHAAAVWVQHEPLFLPGFLRWIVAHGWLGLNMFFVISGYCIGVCVTRAFVEGFSARRFLLDRCQRIFPPYWAAIVLLLVLEIASALIRPGAKAALPDGPLHLLQIVTATETWAGRSSYLLVAWTLSYEIGFYFIAALCLAIARHTQRPSAGAALAAALLLVGLVPSVARSLPLLALWPQFLLGALVWFLQQSVPDTRRRLALALTLFGTVTLAVRHAHSWHAESHLFSGVFALLLVLLLPWDRRLSALAGLRWLGGIGVFSYSLYLVHAPLVGKFRNLVQRWCSPSDPAAFLVPTVATLLAIAGAALFYRVIESRTEAWRRRTRAAWRQSALE